MYTIRQGERTDYNYKEIFCDTQNDFDTLDLNSAEFQKICAGSVAYVIETSNVYILNSKGEWVAQSSGGGGGGDIHNQNKTITENGEYTADAGYTGLGTVTVDVPQPTGVINITENGTVDVTNYASANVKIAGGSGVDWSAIGYSEEPQFIQDGYDYAIQIKNNWVTSTSYYQKFYNDKNLVFMPMVDTSSGTNFYGMFQSCTSLTTIPSLDFSSAINVDSMFSNCPKLTNIGGFKDLGKAYLTTASANYSNYTLSLSYSGSSSITHDSLMNVINNLYDIATAGVQTQKLVLGSTNLAKLTAEEIAIATNKGWAVS